MSDKVAAVLGVGPGLGAAIARRFASEGFGVALLARTEENVAGIKTEIEVCLRALAQSMAREFGPQGVHVSHVIVDGQIDTPRMREMSPDREEHTLLSPEAIAETSGCSTRSDPERPGRWNSICGQSVESF